ncbi:MAG: methylmalonyl Co-A mutase-associated GTPase MeaB [Chromatiales bacterium]|jgi:LAO/AO transport system kinase|nr:methylmalonyl Co-A mutase-associated GTPase MeaB [Chromatiales bacterium]
MATALDLQMLAAELGAGKRRALAKAITLTESTRLDHRALAAELLAGLEPSEATLRLAISGVPGAGKSTFIEAFGLHLIEMGHRVAVLSIDPSSAISGGSILGDKTRMPDLSRHPHAFIRPSPAGNTLGGVARRTRESMALCEAAGFNIVVVETVGVGQSETSAASMTDMFILLLVPGGGDDLQGIKRGIVELADLVLVNKADGDLAAAAGRAAADYSNAFRLIRPRSANWRVRVQTCSALQGKGVVEAWAAVSDFHDNARQSGEMMDNRARQASAWMWREAADGVVEALRTDPHVRERVEYLECEVQAGRMLPGAAADQLISTFRRQYES